MCLFLHVKYLVRCDDKLLKYHSFHARILRIIAVHDEAFAKSVAQFRSYVSIGATNIRLRHRNKSNKNWPGRSENSQRTFEGIRGDPEQEANSETGLYRPSEWHSLTGIGWKNCENERRPIAVSHFWDLLNPSWQSHFMKFKAASGVRPIKDSLNHSFNSSMRQWGSFSNWKIEKVNSFQCFSLQNKN
jgi:hypothetical protein